MTNDKAKTVLLNAAWLGTNEDREKIEEAVSVAIDAIDRQDEDAISRQAAIDAMYGMHMNGKDGVIYDHEHLHGTEGDFSNTILDAVEELEQLPSVTPMQSGWHYTDLPPSDDPYKRYLVVYSPYDRNYGRNTAPRFEIADYYKGDGLYNDKPWHLTISHSVMEKEILAWKDIGIVDEVMQGAKMVEPQESEDKE